MRFALGSFWARVLFAALLALAACARNDKNGKDEATSLRHAQLVPALLDGIPQEGNSLGDPEAPVVLVEFIDLQCPACAAAGVITLPPIIERYVRTGKVRVVLHTLAFLGPDSVEAAQMAAAAGEQNKMFQFVELFLHNQGKPNSDYVTDRSLRRIGEAIPDFDVEKAMRERNSEAVSQRLAEARAAADAHRIEATPSFLLGKAGEEPKLVQLESFDPADLEGHIQALLENDGGT